MKLLEVTIKTLSPVVLTTSSTNGVLIKSVDFISGSVLRGVLAGRFIKEQRLGKLAHEDEDFVNLFFNQLRFVDAYPVVNNQRTIPVPQSIQKRKQRIIDPANFTGKTKEAKEVVDLLAWSDTLVDYKSMKGFATFDADYVYPASIFKSISFHMSRNSNNKQKKGGDRERISGTSLDGVIYNYESIDAGYEFKGYLLGEEDTLDKLIKKLDLVDNRFEGRIGRSKFTGYGQCEFSFGPIEEVESVYPIIDVQSLTDNRIYLRADTPILIETGIVSISQSPLQDIINKFKENNCVIKITKMFANYTTVDGFVSIWGIKRPQVPAIEKGAVFEITSETPWTADMLARLNEYIFNGIGERTEEGFGQLRFWQPQSGNWDIHKNVFSEEQTLQSALCPEVERVATRILMDTLIRKVRKEALRCIQDWRKANRWSAKVAGEKHIFARLESFLGARAVVGFGEYDYSKNKAIFLKECEHAKSVGGVFWKQLNSIKIKLANGHDEVLADLLTKEKIDWPYKDLQLTAEEGAEVLQVAKDLKLALPSFDNDVFFYEFWLWFCRHARKNSKQ